MSDIFFVIRQNGEINTLTDSTFVTQSGAEFEASSRAAADPNNNYFVASGNAGPPGPEFDPTELSGVLQSQIDTNTSNIAGASGHLQGEIDLARFQLSFGFGAGSTPGFTSSSSDFEFVAPFPYPGNNHIVNPPTKLVCFASMNSSNKSGEIRIYDTTNGTEVGLTTFVGNTNIERQSVTLSNLPDEEADLEIQVRRITSGGSISIFSATMF